jgi:tetratricopeptide (TPR) repeat protein
MGLGTAYLNADQPAKALPEFNRCIGMYPQNAVLFNNRGYTHLKLGDTEAALSDANQAVRLDPKLHSAYNTRGETYYAMGRYEDAMYEFMRASDFKPDDPFAMAGQAISIFMMGDPERAKVKWEKLLALSERYADAAFFEAEHHPTKALAEGMRRLVAANSSPPPSPLPTA